MVACMKTLTSVDQGKDIWLTAIYHPLVYVNPDRVAQRVSIDLYLDTD